MENKDVYELTNPQKSIWLTEQYYKGTNINNVCGIANIEEKLDFETLQKAINTVIKTNSSFLINFKLEDGNLVQYKTEYKYFNIEIVELASSAEIETLANKLQSRVFELENNYLFEFKIFKFKDSSGGFMLNIHHLLSDSWTLGLTCKKIIETYNCLINNKEIENITSDYFDFCIAESDYLSSSKFKKDKEYWEDLFKTVPEIASIPSAKNNSSKISCKANRKTFELSNKIVEKINCFCKNNKISAFNFITGIYSLYISRVCNLDDFVIGTPILNRTDFVQKNTTGMFISTVPLRINMNNSSSFNELATSIAKNSMGMLRHQKYPYEYLLKKLREKEPNLPNLYNVLISYQITKAITDGLKYTTTWAFNGNCAEELQIHILDINDTGCLNISYDYKLNKFDEQDIIDLHKRIEHIINQVLSNNNILLNNIDIVTPEEKDEILNKFNNTNVDYPKNKTIVDLFEEQVKKTPNNIAVVFEDKSLTYKELNEKSNQLANYLIENGLKPHAVVGLRLNKQLEMIIGILAIIKAGCCYLPINMQYPEDRVQFMLEDSNCSILLGASDSLNEFNLNVNKINIELSEKNIYENYLKTSNPNINITPEDLIYIIYTSGSTGKPKGAMLCHRNVVRLFKNDNFQFDFNEKDSWTMFHSVAFDFSVWEMYGALLFGGKLVLVTDDIAQDPKLFLELMEKEHVTILNQTPTYFYKLQKAEISKANNNLCIRYIVFGGEALKPNLIKDWHTKYPKTKLINMYGITETTVHVTYKELSEKDLESSSSNIGTPIPTLHVIVVDKNLNLLPFGVEGEMCVLGEGVFKGYLNREDLNKTKLIIDKKYSNKQIYRSGDTAILYKDGHLDYLGRIDTQVKIRGFRIELGEIEEKICQYSNIDTCIVTKKIDNNNREILCAYYIKNGPINISNLRIVLNKHLPNYMIPQYFIEIEKVPININGKTDYKALPLPNKIHSNKKAISVRNKTDKILIEQYKKLLNVENISIEDSFFELGGDSLTAISLCESINKELNTNLTVKDIIEKDIIINLSDYISSINCEQENHIIIEPSNNQEFYPLSSAQKRIYYTHQMIGEKNIVYNIPGAVLIDTILDKNKVQKVFNTIIKNHSSFRTSFILNNNEVMQKISEDITIKINTFKAKEADIREIIDKFPHPFNLSNAPLLRVALYYIDDKKTLLLLDSHHIIMDGLSLSILIKEFCNLYNDIEVLPEKISYKDYAVWENKYISSKAILESESYWTKKFDKSDFSNLNLPYDYNMPNERSYKGNTFSRKIDSENFDKYIDYAKKQGVSPNMFFLSAFFILLYKYTSQEEITIGTPAMGRITNQLENTIGMFVNNLAMNAKIDSNIEFTTFLKSIKNQIQSDLAYQQYPYDLLVKKLNIPSSPTNNPLFDIMFIYQNIYNEKLQINGSTANIIKSNSNISKFNLSLEIEPNTKQINIEYRTDLFKKETISRFYEHYINTLNEIVNNENICIKNISIVSAEEKDLILNKFNDTKVDYPNKTVIELFEEQVEKNPDNIALVFENTSLTYAELNKKANQLAHTIREEKLKPESVVCILLDKSLEMIISILAILKNRCAYLPIDTSYPRERIEYIIKDSNSKLLLTSREIELTNSLIKNIYVDLDSDTIYNKSTKNLNLNGKNTDLAYVMYTSGSTGNPKGVMIENKSIIRLIKNTNYINFKKDDRILQTGSIVFDACTFEIWGAFFNSLPLYIIQKNHLLDASLFHDYILKNKITVMWLTSPLFNQLCEENPHMFRTVRCLLTGGDVLSPKHINRVRIANPNLTVINGYGPTENTTFSCCYKITKQYEDSIPIGKPIANSTCYIVSKDNNIQPIGIPGELLVGGDGVARGYLNNKALTQEKFVYSQNLNERIYKTGDLVKWNSDGTIQFLGRIDTQIKIRGFRVELSEISTIINTYSGIKESYCIFDNVNNTKLICAYIVSDNKVKIQDLKDYLSTKLPKYMIPKYFMQIASLPINQNGKVNKNLLPKKFTLKSTDEQILLPTNSTQRKIYEMYKTVLGISNFSITDNFFNIGGDSITAMKLQIEGLRNNFNITYGDIFKYPSVKELSEFVSDANQSFTNDIKGTTNFNKILHKNIKKNITKETLKRTPIKNVLLTGVTGFLGSHILDSYLKNEKGKIYCLIRTKNNIKPMERLKNTLHFYFDKKYDNLINDRIICVDGDITQENLGLSDTKYDSLGKEITTVIHSAALVKHFGNYEEFKQINVDGTKNLIKFCKSFDCRLMHISTISVSGNNFAEGSYIENDFTEDINYCEKNFYIGQNLENLYVRSKFLAEQAILEEIKNGLKGYILRMGNLTSRYSEGKFQKNHYENAFVARIKSLLQIGAIPDYMLSGYAEFTPIDCCADAIIKIANHYNETFSVFHVFNEKHIQLPDLCDMVNKLGISLKIVSNNEFNSIIDSLLQDKEKSSILSGIVRDFNDERKLIYESNIKIKSDFTKTFLENIGFEWPEIDINYLDKYIRYLSDIGYLNLKTKEN